MFGENFDLLFVRKLLAFIFNGIEEWLFREDLEDDDLFAKFEKLAFNKFRIDKLMVEFIKRMSRKQHLLNEEKKNKFVSIVFCFLTNKKFILDL